MSSVDERIVQMQFNNKQFESGVQTSIKSLDNLKRGLDLNESAKSLSNLDKAGRSFSLSGISQGVDALTNKFSALGIVGVTALMNITNSAINAGKNMISALTIDPIKTGFSEYETKMGSIQTILTNTASKGTSIEDVNAALNELNLYADKTIYNFSEMTRNIGTFTAAGVDLKTSTMAIKGIANLAAGSGSSAEQASNAMYQLSQALAAGKVGLQDWNSVVNAGMGGELFQKALEKTASELGHGRNMAVSFRESLQDGWITTDVLTKTLQKFADDESLVKAATQVKTFTQLFDTMKESVQSGWAQTWETIVGDKEEAATMLTSVNNVFGSIIGSSANARNEMLSFWKASGGRTMMIQSLVNVFKSLELILKPIGEAFREFFPATTGQQLVDLSAKIQNLTEKFKIGEETANKIKDSFKGFFAILDIGKQWVIELGKAIFEVVTYLVPAGDGFLSCTSSIGKFFVILNQTIKSSDIFATVLGKVVNAIKFFIDAIGVAIQFVIGLFKGFDNVDLSGVTAMSDHMKKCFEPVTELGEKVQTVFSIVKDYISDNIIPAFMKLGDSVKEAFSTIVSGISTAFDGNGSVMEILNGGLLAAILLGIRTLVKSIKSIFDGPSSIMENVSNILGGVQDSLETFQNTLKAGVLTKIAIAIAILAGSILVLSLINPERLAASMAAITGLFIELFGSMAAFQKIMGARGLLSMNKLAASMILLGVAINVLAIAMGKLAKLDWNGIAKGLVGIGGLITIMALSSKTISAGSTDLIKGSIGLIAFSVAINLLAIALGKISSMNLGSIFTGLATIALIIGEVALFSKVTGNNKNLISTSVGISILAVSMIVFAKAIEKLGSLPTDQIVRGLASMAGVLVVVAGAMKIMPKDMGLKAIGLVAVGVALNIMAMALTNMGNMSWEQIAKGLIVLAGGLTIIAIALQFFQNGVSGAASILIISAALAILAPALERLGSMSWEQIAKGLIVLVGVFTILGVAAFALVEVVPVIFALAASVALLGVACLAVGVGMAAFAAGLASLAAIGLAGGTVLVAIIAQLIGLIPTIAAAIGEGIVQFAIVIGNGAYDIGNAVVSVMISIMNSIVTVAPQIFTCIQTVLTSWLTLLVNMVPLMVDSGMKLILGILNGVAANIEGVVTAGIDVILNFISGVSSKLPDIINTAFEVIISFINGLADAIDNNHDAIYDAVGNLINSIVNAATDMHERLVEVGSNIVRGFIQGIKDMAGDIVDAATNVISGAVDGIKSFLGIHSPSRVFAEIGKYSDLGLIKGLKDYSGGVSKAAEDVGMSAVDALGNVSSQISDIISNDYNPTITPVLNLDSVTSGVNTMNSMLNRNSGINVSNTDLKARSINNNVKTSIDKIQNGGITNDVLSALTNLLSDPKPNTDSQTPNGIDAILNKMDSLMDALDISIDGNSIMNYTSNNLALNARRTR